MLPRFLADFADERSHPTFMFQSELARYDRFGWQVKLTRTAAEFSTLVDAGVDGFSLSGSGSAAVTTAPMYVAGALCRVTISNAVATTVIDLRAGEDRRAIPIEGVATYTG